MTDALREAAEDVIAAWDASHIEVVALPGLDPMDALRDALAAATPQPALDVRVVRQVIGDEEFNRAMALWRPERAAERFAAEYTRLAAPSGQEEER